MIDYILTIRLIVTVLMLGWAGAVVALSVGGDATATGGIQLQPAASLYARYDSNIFSRENNPVASRIVGVSPSLGVRYAQLKLGYRGNYARYLDSQADNYLDHGLHANYAWQPNSSLNLDTAVDYQLGHEERGSAHSQGAAYALTVPDSYGLLTRKIGMVMGSEYSLLMLDLGAGFVSRVYRNNLDANALRSFDDASFRVRLIQNASVKTRIFAAYSQSGIQYRQASAGLDSALENYFFGFEWKATELTHASMQGGWHVRAFEEENRRDFGGWGWQVDVRWQAGLFTAIKFNSQLETAETNGQGDFIYRPSMRLGVGQYVFGRLQLNLSIAATYNRYLPGDANDIVMDLQSSIDYDIGRFGSIGLSAGYIQRESNQALLDSKRWVAGAQLQLYM